ncbi:peptidoglycan-recognition protein SC2-like [Pomacea canaliculata]|uniref:peptidoglycan-recognition protein SC2-like n=1 Tax=Pomacea canaliculata TaxID=400727 RepID=UPI000D7338BA|nr:peptidoglycan-recognition protein SC2-like [Pomacea canaliculata]
MRKFAVFAVLVLAVLRHYTEASDCACAKGNVDLRGAAVLSSAVVGSLTAGDCLPYLGDTTTADNLLWLHLDLESQDVWAAADHLDLRVCEDVGDLELSADIGEVPEGVVENPENISSVPERIKRSTLQLPGCPTIITRAQWGARQPTEYIGNMARTPSFIFIHHGASAFCSSRTSCQSIIRGWQNQHIGQSYGDIGYNFMVGEDGNVYEGRGWSKIGAHTYNYNFNGIAISFIGNFQSRNPNLAALNAARQLINCAVRNGRVTSSYTLKGHRDVRNTACPGETLYRLIQSWPHYVSGSRLYG